MNSTLFSPRRFRLAGSLLAISSLAFSLALAETTSKSDKDKDKSKKGSVTVKIDDKVLPRAELGELAGYSSVVKQVSPSVVKVRVTERSKEMVQQELPPFFNDPAFRQFFGPIPGQQGGSRRVLRQPPQEGLGSGVVVSADGYILTNNHVVQGADVIKISFNDGKELTAKVVGTDPKSDIAVVKVDAKDLPAITFADSEQVEVGDRVLAVGNPFGIGQTVTSGMVSGLGRATMGLDYEDFIQTDAAINPGNSGGALVDVKGRLVGINTAILSRSGGFQGIGFAIPSNMARGVMEQLVQNGKVVRGFVGVTIQESTEALSEAFGVQEKGGALISDVRPGSPAEKAGLKSGDVILKVDGKPIRDGRHVKFAVANVSPGKTVPFDVIRDGKPTSVNVKVGAQPRDLSRKGGERFSQENTGEDSGTLNGVGVSDINAASRREFDIPNRMKGALVTDVDPTSAAAAAGLQPGDVILEINRQPVYSADDAIKLTENPDNKKSVLRVWNQDGTRYVVVDESEAAAQEDAESEE